MALSANTTWEVRTTGSDTACSGGVVTGASGTDYSQQAAAQYSGTDLVVDSVTNTKVTSASHSFVSADVGNVLRVTSGTGWTVGFYQIVSVASGAATLDRSPAATSTTGGSYCVGGAFASPGQAGAAHVAGNTCWIKAGTYTVTSATANVAGGCVTWANQAANANIGRIVGYNATRGDLGTRPVIVADGVITSFTLVVVGIGNHLENVTVDGNNRTSSRGANGGGGTLYKVKGQNCTNSGIIGGTLWACEATGCSSVPALTGSSTTYGYGCRSYANTVSGIGWGGVWINCISDGNTGANSRGFDDGFVGAMQFFGCTAYGNGGDGFRVNLGSGNSATENAVNCIAYGNGGWGFNNIPATDGLYLINCAGGSNTSGNWNGTAGNAVGFVTLSANPFTNAAGGDFSLNTTAGGGAALRAAGFPGAFPTGTTTSYLDIGAVQHQDSGGGTTPTIPRILTAPSWAYLEG